MLTFKQWLESDPGPEQLGPTFGPNPIQYVPTWSKKRVQSPGRGKDSLDDDITSPTTPLKSRGVPPLGNVKVFYKP